MHDAALVGGIERVRHLDADVQQFRDRRLARAQARVQRRSLQQLHGDEVPALVLADFINRADGFVVQRRR
jgi:hypothetical protein